MAKSSKTTKPEAAPEEIAGTEEYAIPPSIRRLVDMKASLSGMGDRDAAIAALTDAVIELAGAGDVEPTDPPANGE